ncbi:hypothetical protein [Phyllobacterium leguminum]|uniref:Uncharacterized protein n=1 Tax=Phyllobacterium leguminum TaxID=314237 RepID=A0A318TGP1_9HYPH|nr:hypothetical protein [Phyllobacterium leguminum]PYE87862.1 hypothetical protein C7477_11047 [Phyllobacterium leguminum]
MTFRLFLLGFLLPLTIAAARPPWMDKPMVLSVKNPLVMLSAPVPSPARRRCTGAVRIVQAEAEHPVIIVSDIRCRR